jgi:S-DNA-T family DNA segregation ATPase FtsK/SpoIIIE
MAEKQKNISPIPSKKEQLARTRARRRHIICILLMVAGLFATLSILAYSRNDETVTDHLTFADVARIPFNDSVKAEAGLIRNKFGLLGALLAEFFIGSTVGYASVLMPVLVMMWSWRFLRNKQSAKLVTFTNYAIAGALLVSITMALANLIFGVDKEWYGVIGAFLADTLASGLGLPGASILVVTLLFLTVVLAIDLDIHKTIDRFKALGQSGLGRMRTGINGGTGELAGEDGPRDVLSTGLKRERPRVEGDRRR